ncbi:MAG: hypothetical protein HY707_05815 [Ignavibacteriae bacterium]|nr:hypothetical protein [Ignavibacteriota bacterium]
MTRFFITLVCPFFLLMSQMFAQEQEYEPVPPKRSSQAKLGGALGFTQHWLFLDVDPLNKVLRNSGAKELDDRGMLLLGGQGYGYILFVQNLRIGGMGVSGTSKSRSLTGFTRRDVELKVGFGGVTIDYVIPIVPRLDVAIGGLLGGGGLDIKMTRDDGRPKVWNNLWTDYGSQMPVQEYSRKLSGSFFIYQPSVNLEFALLRWLGFRAGVSYVGMAGGDWELDEKYELLGVPDEINGKGFMLNGGIFIGTFIF